MKERIKITLSFFLSISHAYTRVPILIIRAGYWMQQAGLK